jgi:hypothetical protein
MPVQLFGRLPNDERTGGWVDDETSRLGDSCDQPADQSDWLNVRMHGLIDFRVVTGGFCKTSR